DWATAGGREFLPADRGLQPGRNYLGRPDAAREGGHDGEGSCGNRGTVRGPFGARPYVPVACKNPRRPEGPASGPGSGEELVVQEGFTYRRSGLSIAFAVDLSPAAG